MLSVLEVIKKTTDFFAAKGVESARLNAELLVGHVLGLKRMQLYLQFERVLTEPELDRLRPLVRRRSRREPLQYIIGETEFAGLRLKVDRRALIPRPETERLVEIVSEKLADTPPQRVLDLGTGTGALALAFARQWPAAAIVATDASADALALAKENAAACGFAERVSFVLSDWYQALPAAAAMDLVVANPPYLSVEELAEVAPEVREYEPRQALTSGEAGRADLRAIIAGARAQLRPGGLLALETGIAQHALLLAELTAAGFEHVESRPDLTGRDRFLLAF